MTDLPTGPYDVILCDPPWSYHDARTHASCGMARSAYEVMSYEDLVFLPVLKITANPAAMFMWATGPKMPEAIRLMNAWGFVYLTVAFTWVKRYRSGAPYSGLGHYTKSGTEFCLLGRKGKPLPRLLRSVRQIVEAPVTRHSAKPPEVRDRIVQLFGDRPRVELFARGNPAPGWDAWGLEVE